MRLAAGGRSANPWSRAVFDDENSRRARAYLRVCRSEVIVISAFARIDGQRLACSICWERVCCAVLRPDYLRLCRSDLLEVQ